MTAFCDPLAIAAGVAFEFFDYLAHPGDHLWWDLDIYRLFSNEGWMVSGTRHAIILDSWFKEKAA